MGVPSKTAMNCEFDLELYKKGLAFYKLSESAGTVKTVVVDGVTYRADARNKKLLIVQAQTLGFFPVTRAGWVEKAADMPNRPLFCALSSYAGSMNIVGSGVALGRVVRWFAIANVAVDAAGKCVSAWLAPLWRVFYPRYGGGYLVLTDIVGVGPLPTKEVRGLSYDRDKKTNTLLAVGAVSDGSLGEPGKFASPRKIVKKLLLDVRGHPTPVSAAVYEDVEDNKYVTVVAATVSNTSENVFSFILPGRLMPTYSYPEAYAHPSDSLYLLAGDYRPHADLAACVAASHKYPSTITPEITSDLSVPLAQRLLPMVRIRFLDGAGQRVLVAEVDHQSLAEAIVFPVPQRRELDVYSDRYVNGPECTFSYPFMDTQGVLHAPAAYIISAESYRYSKIQMQSGVGYADGTFVITTPYIADVRGRSICEARTHTGELICAATTETVGVSRYLGDAVLQAKYLSVQHVAIQGTCFRSGAAVIVHYDFYTGVVGVWAAHRGRSYKFPNTGQIIALAACAHLPKGTPGISEGYDYAWRHTGGNAHTTTPGYVESSFSITASSSTYVGAAPSVQGYEISTGGTNYLVIGAVLPRASELTAAEEGWKSSTIGIDLVGFAYVDAAGESVVGMVVNLDTGAIFNLAELVGVTDGSNVFPNVALVPAALSAIGQTRVSSGESLP